MIPRLLLTLSSVSSSLPGGQPVHRSGLALTRQLVGPGSGEFSFEPFPEARTKS